MKKSSSQVLIALGLAVVVGGLGYAYFWLTSGGPSTEFPPPTPAAQPKRPARKTAPPPAVVVRENTAPTGATGQAAFVRRAVPAAPERPQPAPMPWVAQQALTALLQLRSMSGPITQAQAIEINRQLQQLREQGPAAIP